jgi:hypothetical protein
MTAAANTVLADLIESGIEVRLEDDGETITVPWGSITPCQRAAMKAHKPELIARMKHAKQLTTELLQRNRLKHHKEQNHD